MKFRYCKYDNPATMSRECYYNGKLQWSYSRLLLEVKYGGINDYPWKDNFLAGDILALPDKFIKLYMDW